MGSAPHTIVQHSTLKSDGKKVIREDFLVQVLMAACL